MRKENFNKTSSDKMLLKQKQRYFVGKVSLRDISTKLSMNDQKAYLAGFKNGARTKLHYHQGDQTLIVTKGVGLLVLFQKISSRNDLKIKVVQKISLKQGDIVRIPKNTMHWHGATSRNNLVHIALNAFHKGRESNTIWFESDFLSSATRLY